jgi:hypothetical protein
MQKAIVASRGMEVGVIAANLSAERQKSGKALPL